MIRQSKLLSPRFFGTNKQLNYNQNCEKLLKKIQYYEKNSIVNNRKNYHSPFSPYALGVWTVITSIVSYTFLLNNREQREVERDNLQVKRETNAMQRENNINTNNTVTFGIICAATALVAISPVGAIVATAGMVTSIGSGFMSMYSAWSATSTSNKSGPESGVFKKS